MSDPQTSTSDPIFASDSCFDFSYIRNTLQRMQRAITDWLIAGPGRISADQSSHHHQESVRQPIAVGTFMSSMRSARPATEQLRRNQNAVTVPGHSPRRSRRVAGEAPESGPFSPPRRQSRQIQTHPPPPQADFTFTHNDPPVPSPGFLPRSTDPLYAHMGLRVDQAALDLVNPRYNPTAVVLHQPINPSLTILPDPLTRPTTAINTSHDHPSTTMATQPQTESNKMCVICYDEEEAEVISLIQPCRICNAHFCTSCIKDMFVNATKDTTLMPPKCCTMLQITYALPHLTTTEADEFRAKFEEWLTPHKTYCPVPKCSKFIPDRFVLHPPKKSATLWDVLHKEFPRIMEALLESHHSRFIRTPASPMKECVTDFFKRVHRPIFMDTIVRKMPYYRSLTEFITDFNAMIECTQKYSHNHKVATSGILLRKQLDEELDKISSKAFAGIAKLPSSACFACPDCRTGICVDCKQIVHPGNVCDTTFKDEEMAMLETFGYKKCPKCGHGVKRMFGCRHMQCRCGSHWCWACLCSIDECDGECTSYDAESEEEEHFSEDEIDDDLVPVGRLQATGGAGAVAEAGPGPEPEAGSRPPRIARIATRPTAQASQTIVTPDQPKPSIAPPVNLDAGGDRVWAASTSYFGDEPGEDVQDPMWACNHDFDRLHLSDAATKRGMSLEMECLHCFGKIKALPHPIVKSEEGHTYRDIMKNDKEKDPAWQCVGCEIVLCSKCKDKAKVYT